MAHLERWSHHVIAHKFESKAVKFSQLVSFSRCSFGNKKKFIGGVTYRINWNTPPRLITRGVPILNFGPGGIKNDGGLTPFRRNLLLNMQCDP